MGLVFVSACFTSGSSTNGNPDSSAPISDVTYYKDVAPIIQNHCQGCHVPGGIGAFPLLTYDDAHANSDAIVYETQQKLMPPWGARTTSECAPRFGYKNNPSLTDVEIATLQAWHVGGDAMGDPKDAPPATTPLPTDLPNAISLAPAVPYSLPPNSTSDYFRCFVLDPQFTAQTYITGTFVKPGNATIVHHALIFAVPAGATIPPPTDGVPDQYTCFGSSGVSGQQLVAVWAPGGPPMQYPTNVAHPIAAGTKFIMQIHYHPHANATFAPDTTTFEYSTTTNVPTHVVGTALIGNFQKAVNANGIGLENPPFSIPPDTPSQVFTMDYTAPSVLPQGRILAVAPHMHLVGVDEKVTIHRAAASQTDPQDECFVQVPSWNFNWQRSYEFDTDISTLPLFSPGDQVKIRCTYDNTMQNPFLAQALTEANQKQTTTVTLGEQTLDEMCLVAAWYVFPP